MARLLVVPQRCSRRGVLILHRGCDGLPEVARVVAGFHWPERCVFVGSVACRSTGRGDGLQSVDHCGQQRCPGCVRREVQMTSPAVLCESGGDAEQP